MWKSPLPGKAGFVHLQMIGYFFRYTNAANTYTMKMIIEILLCVSCLYAIAIQLLRIIWLYFPSFKQRKSLYKIKVPGKTEMLLYFILATVVMAYFIKMTLEKVL